MWPNSEKGTFVKDSTLQKIACDGFQHRPVVGADQPCARQPVSGPVVESIFDDGSKTLCENSRVGVESKVKVLDGQVSRLNPSDGRVLSTFLESFY